MCIVREQISDQIPHLERFAMSLVGHSRRADADDLVQDCVERALVKAEQFEPGTNLRAWLFTMMRNLFLSGKRHDKVRSAHVELVSKQEMNSRPADQAVSLLLKQTDRAIKTLPKKDQALIRDVAVYDMPYQQIAEARNERVGTLKSRLSRARIKLRDQIGFAVNDSDFSMAA
ncbi:sigma-70 family RNA polymerase sigma factor [Hwanghaeella grinnelliae]|uniref:Sigma-70 family RNA polymerase sigma factor n=1 Tax=Hwanghaeella grinnelliae TaxID=2500179 RepID=A0A3S2ZA43_9PROT|nr:sigma-70 family RNA polymerase sigma factor [Hwanghaeella grinnelliae]RVU38999.1 sigma-70 family RNA polymerase sigma factor [Hwanghaeella grinnelliae]